MVLGAPGGGEEAEGGGCEATRTLMLSQALALYVLHVGKPAALARGYVASLDVCVCALTFTSVWVPIGGSTPT